MDQVKWCAPMFMHEELKPIDERIVHAFVRAKARDPNPVRGIGPRFGGWKATGRREDMDLMPCRCKQTRNALSGDCQPADIRCILFAKESNFHTVYFMSR